jgi:hypothetical protein
MITFPAWVDDPRAPKDDLASRRLRFLVLKASNWCTPSGNIASFADFCKIERTEVHAAIKGGKFSAKMAQQIEKACGRDCVRREWLIYPTEIHDLT